MAATHDRDLVSANLHDTSHDIERIGSKDQKFDIITDAVEGEIEDEYSAEYHEYLRLRETFTGKALSRLHRKCDWHVIPSLFFVYCLTYIDRSNVGNARLFGAQEDNGMTGTQWNIGLSLLFITYALGSPIANAFVKIYSTKLVLPVLCIGCGASIIGAGCSSNVATWYSLRLVLGLFEGGIYSACAYSLTTWYDPSVIASRISFFYMAGTSSGGISGLLAYGIGQLDGHWGYRGWRWIYVLEGFVSVCLGFFSFYWIQGDPEKPHRWLTADEQRFIILRTRFAYGADKGGNQLMGFSWRDFASAVKSPHNLILGFSNFSYCTALYAFSFTLPTIVKNMGFTAAEAQAMSAPPYFIALIAIAACGLLTDKYRQRSLAIIIPGFVGFVGMLICMTTADKKELVPLTYIACVLVACGLYAINPILSSFVALQNAGQTKRAAALSIGVIFTQFGGVLGSNIYLAPEAPTYKTGFGTSLAVVFTGCCIVPALYYIWIGRINKRREQMSDDQIRAMYTPEELEKMGDRSPYYRYER